MCKNIALRPVSIDAAANRAEYQEVGRGRKG